MNMDQSSWDRLNGTQKLVNTTQKLVNATQKKNFYRNGLNFFFNMKVHKNTQKKFFLKKIIILHTKTHKKSQKVFIFAVF